MSADREERKSKSDGCEVLHFPSPRLAGLRAQRLGIVEIQTSDNASSAFYRLPVHPDDQGRSDPGRLARFNGRFFYVRFGGRDRCEFGGWFFQNDGVVPFEALRLSNI